MRNDLGHIKVRRVFRMKNELDLAPSAVGTGPAAQRDSRNILPNEQAQFVRMFNASRSVITFIAAQNDQ